MNELSIEIIHLLQLEIAKEIKRVCEQNDINYFLIGGTLLGAVRHGGFIPWDDDMDIGMTATNYKRFVEIAPNCLGKRFSLHTFENDKKCGYIFAKVRLRYTHMREAILEGTGIDNGIFVDVFPYDMASENSAKKGSKHLLKMRLLSKLLMIKSGYRLNDISHSVISKATNMIMKIIPVSRNKCWIMIKNELKKSLKNNRGEYYIERDGMFKGNFVFSKNVIDKKEYILFENIRFNAPKNYDSYLKIAYGDYMKLPPEKDRIVGHSVLDVSIDKPLEWYFEDSV